MVFIFDADTNYSSYPHNGQGTICDGMKSLIKHYREEYKKMVTTILGRTPNSQLLFSEEDIEAVKAGIEANPRLKPLDAVGFCFVPPHHKKASGTQCECVHCTHYKK